MNPRILIIDDEPHLTGLLKYILLEEGYDSAVAVSGELGLLMARKEAFDLILLDINLPGMNGMEVCRELQKDANPPPIIFLSCRDDGEDAADGLESGGEDYITKPFNHRELALRIKKVLRRSGPPVFRCGNMLIDPHSEQVTIDSETVHLSPIEFSVILYLASVEGRVVSWQELIDKVWKYHDWEGGHEIVKVTIGRIRKKIETDSGSPRYIHNEWGRGYRLNYSFH